jgi:PAS domain S-box-containing protein
LVQDDSSLFTEETFVRLDRKNVAVEIAALRVHFLEEPAVQLLVHTLAEQKEKAGAALREKEASKAAILNASMDAIICLDHEAKIIEWNPTAEILFGLARAEALGRCLDSLIVPSALPEKYPPGLAEYLVTGKGRLGGHPIGIMARHASGREFPAVLAITRNPQSEPPVFTCFIHDVTPRQRVEAALRQSEERLRLQSAECEQRVQDHLTELHTAYGAMELYASSLSSELRTPLGHFESLVEILQNDASRHMDEKSRHYLRTICESLGQAGRMIGDLLALSPSSHAGLHDVRVNLVEVIKDILRDLWSELENRQTARCRCELPRDGGPPSLLRHALYNLIAHALAGQPAKSEIGRLRSNGTGSGTKDLAPLWGDSKRSCPALESGGNGAEATDNARLQEEAAELRKLEEELERREQALKEASTALKIREEFINQSETTLLQKIEAQQERESEIEQKQEDLQRMMVRIDPPNDEIMEPVALS